MSFGWAGFSLGTDETEPNLAIAEPTEDIPVEAVVELDAPVVEEPPVETEAPERGCRLWLGARS